MPRSKPKAQAEATRARDLLRSPAFGLAPGSRVYTMLVHHSRTGTRRLYRVFVVNDGEIYEVSVLVARAIGYGSRNGQIIVDGCNFDGGHDIASTLAAVLFPAVPCPRGGMVLDWSKL